MQYSTHQLLTLVSSSHRSCWKIRIFRFHVFCWPNFPDFVTIVSHRIRFSRLDKINVLLHIDGVSKTLNDIWVNKHIYAGHNLFIRRVYWGDISIWSQSSRKHILSAGYKSFLEVQLFLLLLLLFYVADM